MSISDGHCVCLMLILLIVQFQKFGSCFAESGATVEAAVAVEVAAVEVAAVEVAAEGADEAEVARPVVRTSRCYSYR